MNFGLARAKEPTPEETEIKRLEREIESLEFLKARRLHDVQSLGKLIGLVEDKIRVRTWELIRLKETS